VFPLGSAVATRYPPVVVWSLILVNAAAFLYQLALPPAALEVFLREWALVPRRYFDPAWALAHGLDPYDYTPFLTNMFLHGGWFHILSNMWTLWIFGPAVEDRMGPGRFLVFYLLCGIGASVAHALVNAASPVPALGASGAISGVIGAYMRLFPLSRLIVMIPILFVPFFFEMPAALFALIWFLTQVVQGVGAVLAPALGGGVAWWAHIGGFVVGFLLVPWIHPAHRLRFHRDEGRLGFRPDGRRIRMP